MAVLDYSAARSLFLDQLRSMPLPDDECVLLEEATMERPWGWVFFYGSRRFHETGDTRFLVAGNAPFFVRREEGPCL